MARAEHSVELQKPITRAVNFGRGLQVRGEWQGAIGFYTNLLIELRLGEVTALNERGLNFRMTGDYDAAEVDFKKARSLSRTLRNPEGELTALVGLVDLARTGEWATKYKRGKDLGQASVWRLQSEQVLEKMPDGWNLAKVNAFTQFGLLDHELREDEQAVKSYSEAEIGAKAMLLTSPDHTNLKNRLMRILTNKSIAQAALGDIDGAIVTQTEALTGYRELGDIRGVVNVCVALARIYKGTGNMEAAKRWYERAIASSQREEGGEVVVVDELMHQIAQDELAELNPD